MVQIVVVGSINMDVVNHVSHYPTPGETIRGSATSYNPGGKGANQAVAAVKSGASVTILGAVGSDLFGRELKSSLSYHGVCTDWIIEKAVNSGLAFIMVDSAGENCIVLSTGANGQFEVSDIQHAIGVFERADIALFQNEIPWNTTLFGIRQARQRGVKVFLNPAPALQVPIEIFPLINLMILNEPETKFTTGVSVDTIAEAETAAQYLIDKGVEAVIITMGDQGSVYMERNGERIIMPAFAVMPHDTTAAGDTFVGAFATFYGEGRPVEAAMRFASAAAAIGVTRKGAQESIPTRHEIEHFLGNIATGIVP